jgi:hypothetical protein|tara:strand:+ start:247 stop:513 length:267 start_codon:yes stop_codon:yes gene_type:complete
MKKYLTILLAIGILTGCEVYRSPNGQPFPLMWGEPPEIQTRDYVKLSGNYGYGSSTLKTWIMLHEERDRLNALLRENDNQFNRIGVPE